MAEADEDNRGDSAESRETSEGDGERGLLVSDDSGVMSKGVEDNDVLRFGDEVAKGVRCLRFLLDNSNRQRRVFWTQDFCDFCAEPDADDSSFPFVPVLVLPEEEEETTDEERLFFLLLRILKSVRLIFSEYFPSSSFVFAASRFLTIGVPSSLSSQCFPTKRRRIVTRGDLPLPQRKIFPLYIYMRENLCP